MEVSVKGALNAANTLKALANRSRKAPVDLMQRLPVREAEKIMLRMAKELTPVGKSKQRGELGLKESWRTKVDPTRYTLRISLYSMLEKMGKRQQARLRSVELGNQFRRLTVKEDFKFRSEMQVRTKNKRGWKRIRFWTFLSEGDVINRPSRRGLHIMDEMRQRLPQALSPIRERIRERLQQQLRRAS